MFLTLSLLPLEGFSIEMISGTLHKFHALAVTFVRLILEGKDEGRRLFGMPACRWESNIKTDLKTKT